MRYEQKIPTSVRVPESLVIDLHMELNKSNKSKSEWLIEAIEEKLQNEGKEILDAEIKYAEGKLLILKNKAKSVKEKKKDISSLSEKEMAFLIWSKQQLAETPQLIKGKISDYKFRFTKNYRISIQDFYELMENADAQYILNNDKNKKEKLEFNIERLKNIKGELGKGARY